MLTDKDTEKLIDAFKEVFPTKTDLLSFQDTLLEDFDELKTSVDACVNKVEKYSQEMMVASHQSKKDRKVLQEVAQKTGVKMEY